MLNRVCVYLLFLFGLCVHPVFANNGPMTYSGVNIVDLYTSIPRQNRVLLTGDYEKDRWIFTISYPRYLSNKAAAEQEHTTMEAIVEDNYRDFTQRALKDRDTALFRKMFDHNAVLGKVNLTKRHLQNGFCLDTAPNPRLSTYFYCFEYNGTIYRVVTKLDYFDSKDGAIEPVWVYEYYGPGPFDKFFVPGPYGVLPTPVISGDKFQPDIFIN